jgi:hypothetical protein
MQQFLLIAFRTSLMITFMWGAMQVGMIFFWLTQLIDRGLSNLPIKMHLWLRKPLYDCLFCMSSFWGILFTFKYFSFSFNYLFLLLTIGGINYLISTFIEALTYNNGKEAD